MSTYQKAYPPLLQGVSQQEASRRLPGQVQEQVNMMSDPVTGARRRPGSAWRTSWTWADVDMDHVAAWTADVGGVSMQIILNTATGNIRLLDEEFVELASLDAGAYLTTDNIKDVRGAAVGQEFFLANVSQVPALTFAPSGSTPDPADAGFYYVVSGAFGRAYGVTVTTSSGVFSATYNTPDGSSPGDSVLATPEYIADQIEDQLILAMAAFSDLHVYRDGPYVYIEAASLHPGSIVVTTPDSTLYSVASKSSNVRAVGDLPAKLPPEADGYIVRVGTGESAQYYEYQDSTQSWVEAAAFNSPAGIVNVPISVYYDEGLNDWALNTSAFEGRLSGDDTNNPAFEFMTQGITGMGTYQGRLVLLSGPLVALSASGKPRRFFRTTVVELLNSDPVEIGSNQASSAAYEWCVGFQKDLVLFSRKYQAVLPSGNSAITPSTATVVPTSGHETDTTCSPVLVGRTLMYPKPRSAEYFGMLEMIPSQYTDSQYVSQDATPHLPTFLQGRCRAAVSSGVSNMVLFAPTDARNVLLVHEYQWDGDTKSQQAWHRWEFPWDVACVYFVGDQIALAFVHGDQITLGTIDPQAGVVNASDERRAFVDLYVNIDFTSNTIALPGAIQALGDAAALVAVSATGDLQGEVIGTSVSGGGTSLTTVMSWPDGTASVGTPYRSILVPSPPQVTDFKDQVVNTGKATVQRFVVGVNDTPEFQVRVDDRYSSGDVVDVAPLTFSSPELTLGHGLYADEAGIVIPARTDMRTTLVEFSTDGVGEMNITWLEYVAKFNPKIQRR